MVLKQPRRSVKLVRPGEEPLIDLPVQEGRIRKGVSIWRAGPPAPTADAPNKRANRPKLLEPLPDGSKEDERLRLAYFFFLVWIGVVMVAFDLKYPSWRHRRYHHAYCDRCGGY